MSKGNEHLTAGPLAAVASPVSNPVNLVPVVSTSDMRRVLNEAKRLRKLQDDASKSFKNYLKLNWWMPHKLLFGAHTEAMCNMIDEAIDLFLQKQSSYWLVEVPFRHGKSDICSRAMIGYFLGRLRAANLDPDAILTGYGAGLVEGFSSDAKMIIDTPRYRNVFPACRMKHGKNNVQEWRLQGCYGKVTAAGLGGSITGKGGALVVIDDYFKNREEAESELMRDKVWDQITNDIMTRLAPVSITIVVATPWHVDGPGKRILKAMEEDPDFPRFRHLRFPARTQTGTGADGKAIYSYLFPERYSERWYKSQYAQLGPYASRGLLDCDPVPASGNCCKREWFTIVDTVPAGMRVVRGWDLAATAKKSADFCCGFLVGKAPNGRLFLIDDFRTQSPAAAIKTTIMNIAQQDIEKYGRDNYDVVIEQEPGATGIITTDDFITALRQKNIRAHRALAQGDKLTRALPFFAYCAANFEQGEAYCTGLLKGKWNNDFLNTVTSFPEVNHDDEVDACAHAYNRMNKPSAGAVG